MLLLLSKTNAHYQMQLVGKNEIKVKKNGIFVTH